MQCGGGWGADGGRQGESSFSSEKASEEGEGHEKP